MSRSLLVKLPSEGEAAKRLMAAIARVTADPKCHTPDLGGTATTQSVTDALIAAIEGANH